MARYNHRLLSTGASTDNTFSPPLFRVIFPFYNLRLSFSRTIGPWKVANNRRGLGFGLGGGIDRAVLFLMMASFPGVAYGRIAEGQSNERPHRCFQ